MGYISNVTGGFEFSRPLSGAETRALQTLDIEWSWPYSLEIETEERETDEGTLTVTTCTGISTEDAESGKYYGLGGDTRKLIRALPEDVTVTGYVERIGEEWPDAERLYAKGHDVVSVKAIITWPEP